MAPESRFAVKLDTSVEQIEVPFQMLRCYVAELKNGVTYHAAGAFDIRGWVRNDPDGSVEIDAQGTADNLRSFIEQIEIGPPSSRVDDLDVVERETDDRPDEFRVVR